MWKTLSLRTRLLLPFGLMFLVVLLVGAIALSIFAPLQLIDENEPAAHSARVVADALNGALRVSANPQETLDAFVGSLGTSEAIQFRGTGSGIPAGVPVKVRTPLGGVPDWFIDLLTLPEVGASFPITIGGTRVGDIVFSPDISADIFEKWIGFLAVAASGIALTVLMALIAYFTVGAALRPLRSLSDGLTQMRMGEYTHLIAASGPPEIRRSSEEANELARTLNRLSLDNRGLIRKIVSLQDDERRDIARELHDELGPLLFGIRASTVALLEAVEGETVELASSARGIVQSVEALQQTNRRILERLRPLYIRELGLVRSIQTLLQNARSQAPQLRVTADLDRQLDAIDGLLSETVYRVIQEGVTNVLRHAGAHAMNVEATVGDCGITVEISDDGVGFPVNSMFGRGLTGMHERVRALDGTLELLRRNGRTLVRCRLPADEAVPEKQSLREA